MVILYEKYGQSNDENKTWLADTSADVSLIENPPMGSTVYIIREKKAMMADSTGQFYEM